MYINNRTPKYDVTGTNFRIIEILFMIRYVSPDFLCPIVDFLRLNSRYTFPHFVRIFVELRVTLLSP